MNHHPIRPRHRAVPRPGAARQYLGAAHRAVRALLGVVTGSARRPRRALTPVTTPVSARELALTTVRGAAPASDRESASGGHLVVLVLGPGIRAVNDLPTVIDNLTTWVVGILAGAATLFLTIGGARYLMAGGDPGEVERAKGALKSAALGYALAMLAPVFMNILRQILGV